MTAGRLTTTGRPRSQSQRASNVQSVNSCNAQIAVPVAVPVPVAVGVAVRCRASHNAQFMTCTNGNVRSDILTASCFI